MFPKLACPRCRRSTAVNRDGQIRSHYCPHRNPCEPKRCHECAADLERTSSPAIIETMPQPQSQPPAEPSPLT
jgi:hypothetical protein